MDGKGTLFTLAVAFLFVALVYFGVNTFVPSSDLKSCYNHLAYTKNLSDSEMANLTQQADACNSENLLVRNQENSAQYKIFMIVGIIAVIVAFYKKFSLPIRYGFFIGADIVAFFSTLASFNSVSVVNFVLLLGFFVSAVAFVNFEFKKNIKKH